MTGDASNVLLIVLDSVRYHNTSIGGYHRPTTPFLNEFQSEALSYNNARSPSNWTLPSHVSIFTGIHERRHNISEDEELIPGNTFVERLSDESGYTTGVFSENVYLTEHPSNLNGIFNHVCGRPEQDDPVGEDDTNEVIDGFYYADEFINWKDRTADSWFACINLMDAHIPYVPQDEYNLWAGNDAASLRDDLPSNFEWLYYGGVRPQCELDVLMDLYDGCIRQADAVVKHIIAELEQSGDINDTLIIITSDHGEGFGESSELPMAPEPIVHGLGVNEELLHVPLLIRYPDQPQHDVVSEFVSLTDLSEVVTSYVDSPNESAQPDRPLSGDGTSPVVASRPAISGELQVEAGRFCENVKRLVGQFEASYGIGPEGKKRKKIQWKDKGERVRFSGLRRIRSDGFELVNEPTGRADDAGITRKRDTGVSDPVKERLEDLGYKT